MGKAAGEETRIFLDPRESTDDMWLHDVGSRTYIPVDPVELDSRRDTGWSVYDLEKRAFDAIPPEFVGERMIAGAMLADLADRHEPVVLPAYGPEEGDYYVVLSEELVTGADIKQEPHE